MAVSIEDVRYIAALARLRFTEAEEQRLAEQMTTMLEYVGQLQTLDTTGVPPMSHVLDLVNVMREDVVQTRISREEALRNAPDADEAYFRVPRVIE
ncbi:aspartyl/glutamyl-tRNA(Asn/Gln) amidotransferase subunit C [Rhodothermaceae bacterium RA]|nr:aspartyl/glutamyl-tRNA(Asn/Gln) amidotransferase subunit C [Rhodothermaceae bacterium RA]